MIETVIGFKNFNPPKNEDENSELIVLPSQPGALCFASGLNDMFSLTFGLYAIHAQTSTHVDLSRLPIRQKAAKIVAFQWA